MFIVSVSASTGRGKYFKYSEMDRYVIGKYASQHGDYASAKLFMDSSDLRASTVHTCKLMYLAGRLAEPKKKINMIGKMICEWSAQIGHSAYNFDFILKLL